MKIQDPKEEDILPTLDSLKHYLETKEAVDIILEETDLSDKSEGPVSTYPTFTAITPCTLERQNQSLRCMSPGELNPFEPFQDVFPGRHVPGELFPSDMEDKPYSVRHGRNGSLHKFTKENFLEILCDFPYDSSLLEDTQ
ncbi:hypothetical protein Tco_0646649 [Tanacetum coccineum]